MHTIRVCDVVNYKSLYSPPWPVWTPAPLSVETSSPVDSAPAKSSKKDHSRFWNVSFVSALVVGFRLCASLQVPSSLKQIIPTAPTLKSTIPQWILALRCTSGIGALLGVGASKEFTSSAGRIGDQFKAGGKRFASGVDD